MVTKLQAADLARRAGATVVIASGGEPDILLRLAAGEALGTRFSPGRPPPWKAASALSWPGGAPRAC